MLLEEMVHCVVHMRQKMLHFSMLITFLGMQSGVRNHRNQ